MNKKTPNKKESKSDIPDGLKENRFFQFLVENRQFIPYVFIALLILLGIAFKVTGGRTSEAETNYLIAENYFNRLKETWQEGAGMESLQANLEKLQEITADYPSLRSRYDGTIAQLLLLMNKPEEARQFILRTLERTTQDDLRIFTEFSKTTLLIAEGKLAEALKRAKNLKKKIVQDDQKKIPHLFAYTLLRIAMLEKVSGTPEGESEAWDEWKNYAEKTPDSPFDEAIATIGKSLQEGSFSLNEYINLRKKTLEDARVFE